MEASYRGGAALLFSALLLVRNVACLVTRHIRSLEHEYGEESTLSIGFSFLFLHRGM